MTIVDVIMRNTDANEMYLSYLVALLCIIDKVDFADPVRNNGIVKIKFKNNTTIVNRMTLVDLSQLLLASKSSNRKTQVLMKAQMKNANFLKSLTQSL